MIFEIEPVAAPRMTRRDGIRWLNAKHGMRECVANYMTFREELKLRAQAKKFKVPSDGMHLIFNIPMPMSWTKAKSVEMARKPHKRKPDIDNLVKSFLDALCGDDSYVYDIRASKFWDWSGSIEVRTI